MTGKQVYDFLVEQAALLDSYFETYQSSVETRIAALEKKVTELENKA
jgi:hypothetical protein